MLKRILFSLPLLTLAQSAFAAPRWYDPKYDANGTLRVCYRVGEITQNEQKIYVAKLLYSGADTGTDKLDRKVSYSTIDDVEYQQVGYPDGSDPISYAFLNKFFACEISWEYGLHWVVSNEEVSGDR
jgi:hypothetical protein